MPIERKPLDLPESEGELVHSVRSLRELIDLVTGRTVQEETVQVDAGLAETLPFPFLALVGQQEMKLALLLAIINPLINGVLLVGPRGTGKTTIARSLVDLLPDVQRSACFYGCLPEDILTGGIDAVCRDCARKYAEGISLTRTDQVRLVELPLNATLSDVIGGLDDQAQEHERMRIHRGILAQADLNVLYVDEVNLLNDDVANALLDAASAGAYRLRRGQASAAYRSRFTLIGSMNPEEGALRSQVMDRFGLRVVVHGLNDAAERLEAYRRTRAFQLNPRAVTTQFAVETEFARQEIIAARELLPQVEIPPAVAAAGAWLVQISQVDSLRAEVTLFEAARALAAADARQQVRLEDLKTVAPMALRLRRSSFMLQYFQINDLEEQEIQRALNELSEPRRKRRS
jgi:magnesium chelatase subunit I